jgi:two-component system, sensor histidine kinase and response regulator
MSFFKVLVIEDEDSIRENITELLELNNYTVIGAPDGFCGIQQILSQEPDLVICDIMMPMLSGLEVLRLARKNPVSANIPFIFLSAKANQSDIRNGMNLGADDYLTKPFLASDLLETVKGRIARRQSVLKEVKQRVQKVKEDTHSVASHEYNTPLNGILGSVNLLLECYNHLSQEEAIEMLQVIKKSGEQLGRLFKNITLQSTLHLYSSGELPYKQGTTTDAATLVEKKAKTLADAYNRTNDLNLTLTSCKIAASEEDILKITEELIDNAFKYSVPNSPVSIHMHTAANFCHIDITNMGRGMTREEINAVGPFVQFNREIHKQQGLGLGLYLAQQLTRLNRGVLQIHSSNQELTAHVKLPLL